MARKSENPTKAALHMRAWRERKKLGLPPRPVGRPRIANPTHAALAKREYRARKAQKALAESLAAKRGRAAAKQRRKKTAANGQSVSHRAA